jgi:hypothetical protein
VVGDSVEIDFYPSGGSEPNGSGTVEVTEIRAGTTDQLVESGLSLDPEELASSVYYVDVTFENEGDETVLLHDVGGEDPDGNLIHSLLVLDFGGEPFAPCPGVPEELAAGEQTDACTIILVPDGTEIEKIYYHPGADDDFIYWKLE